MAKEITINLRQPHARQAEFLDSKAKRRIIRAGRRGGKTVGMGIYSVTSFLDGHRVLYGAPTQDQVQTFWFEVCEALRPGIEANIFVKNETNHTIELPHSKQRIRAKTAWNADTLRGDYADRLILDEFQLMSEDTWDTVGAPMLLDNDGDAIFVYTPPSLRNASRSKATNPRHAADMFKKHSNDKMGRWECFHFTSMENPYISIDALTEIRGDMTALAYQQEILAEDIDDAPGALWTRALLESCRRDKLPSGVEIKYSIVAVDPSTTSTGDECGICTVGYGTDNNYYLIDDSSIQASPHEWAMAVVAAFNRHDANYIVYESNQGGDMVRDTILACGNVPIRSVHASRSKQARAEPITILYEQGRFFHLGRFDKLENEQCTWQPLNSTHSPNRIDALVWAATWIQKSVGRSNQQSRRYT